MDDRAAQLPVQFHPSEWRSPVGRPPSRESPQLGQRGVGRHGGSPVDTTVTRQSSAHYGRCWCRIVTVYRCSVSTSIIDLSTLRHSHGMRMAPPVWDEEHGRKNWAMFHFHDDFRDVRTVVCNFHDPSS